MFEGLLYGRVILIGALLCLGLQPQLQLLKGQSSMREAVLLRLVHLGICLSFIFEDWIPA